MQEYQAKSCHPVKSLMLTKDLKRATVKLFGFLQNLYLDFTCPNTRYICRVLYEYVRFGCRLVANQAYVKQDKCNQIS